MRIALTLTLALTLAGLAFASDGVLEINQTCAINTGCFSGDTPGLPVTIDGSAGRSYRLTGDLLIQSVNSDGILVSTPDVAIDLGGFTIIGLACLGARNDCTPFSGAGTGVVRSLSTIRGISIKNGSIIGMGFHGLLLGDQSEVSDLRVRWNRLLGISVGAGSIVSDNVVYENGSSGIKTGGGSVVSGNAAYGNADHGIQVDAGSIVSGNTAYLNEDSGIVAINGGTTVQRNTVRSNGAYGLSLGSTDAYRENVINANTTGTVSGGVNMFSNSCNGTTSCP